jgi:small subunit ribosomal protein S14
MAKKSKIAQAKRLEAWANRAHADGRKVKFTTRVYTRCKNCGRPRGVLQKFALCRICFRKLSHEGMLPGVVKSSW